MINKKEQLDSHARDELINQEVTVKFDYPVRFTRNVFCPDNPLLSETIGRLGEAKIHRVLFCIDQGLLDAQRDIPSRIDEYFHHHRDKLSLAGNPQIIPGGMKAKTQWSAVRDLITTAGNCNLDRQSFIIALGGGSVLDMVGFAASIIHRGIRLIRIPTTTLSQDDAGIGVKNGMDEHGQKNFIGTFAPPFAVINDFDFLSTLTQSDWIAGVAEALKVAIIKDADFFEFLRQNAPALKNRNADAMEETVWRCAKIHLDHIRTSGDPFEFGSARPLDFGHWAGHMLETMSNYELSHGCSVAIGIAIDSYCAMKNNLITQNELLTIIETIRSTGMNIWSDLLKRRNLGGQLEVLDGLERFRQHLGGALTITLPDGIGNQKQVHHLNTDDIEDAISYLEYLSRNTRCDAD